VDLVDAKLIEEESFGNGRGNDSPKYRFIPAAVADRKLSRSGFWEMMTRFRTDCRPTRDIQTGRG